MNYIVIFKDGTAFYMERLYGPHSWNPKTMLCAICGGKVTFDGDNWQDLKYYV